jgi:hypothetical protein
MHTPEIMVLMTGTAFYRIHSLPVGSASDLHCVRMAVVSLTRKISGGVTIHAPRMAQYRNDGLKSSSGAIVRRCILHSGGFGMFGLRAGIECQQECG